MGRLIARVALGVLFIAHGLQKLLGWFDGPGPEGAAEMMDDIGLSPGRRNAMMSGAVETTGGAMLALGLLTPAAGAALNGAMVTAIRTVHLENGFSNQNGGYEYPLTLIAAVTAIVDAGPGPDSLDATLGIEKHGNFWSMTALAAGCIGSALIIERGKRAAAEQEPERASSAADEPAEAPMPAGATV